MGFILVRTQAENAQALRAERARAWLVAASLACQPFG
jgi:hypothetical protein